MRCATRIIVCITATLAGLHTGVCTVADEPAIVNETPGVLRGPSANDAASADGKPDDQEVPWILEYDEARLKGIEQAKPVLLFVTSDNCIYCRKMYAGAFQDQRIIQELRQEFIPAKLKLDPSGELAHQLRITIYPTVMIINPDGTILDYARGFLTADNLQVRMARVTDARLAALPK